MPISFQELRTIMKSSKLEVFREEAATGTDCPYIIYEFVNETKKTASNSVLYHKPLYFIAVISDGTEDDISPLKEAFEKNKVPYADFTSGPYELENDSRVTQYITYVRCIN